LDFALILVVVTFFAGFIWAIDSLFFKRNRLAGVEKVDVQDPILVEYAKSFFPILLLVLVLRSFLFEPFRIPSGSMMPTLLAGDFIFVNKFAYGLRLPVVNTKILEIGRPERGDVLVFKLPSDPSTNYIKRVIGLPGDTVVYDSRDKQLNINGSDVVLEVLEPYQRDGSIYLVHEDLGEAEHLMLHNLGRLSPGGTYVVPEGHYFMMGDNRDNSRDSRFPGVSFIPESRLVGKAVRIWMSWQGGPVWDRIGKGIH